MKELESKTYYELLGLTHEASKEEIKAAYREIARVYHPDSHFFDDIVGSAPLSAGDNDVFKAVTNAYNILSDDVKRAEYDKILPKGLATWDSEDERASEPIFPPKSNPADQAGRKAQAFGTFGRVDAQKSAMEEAFEQRDGPRAVSEVLRAHRSWWRRLLSLFGL